MTDVAKSIAYIATDLDGGIITPKVNSYVVFDTLEIENKFKIAKTNSYVLFDIYLSSEQLIQKTNVYIAIAPASNDFLAIPKLNSYVVFDSLHPQDLRESICKINSYIALSGPLNPGPRLSSPFIVGYINRVSNGVL